MVPPTVKRPNGGDCAKQWVPPVLVFHSGRHPPPAMARSCRPAPLSRYQLYHTPFARLSKLLNHPSVLLDQVAWSLDGEGSLSDSHPALNGSKVDAGEIEDVVIHLCPGSLADTAVRINCPAWIASGRGSQGK